jgi:hypothetical protein
MWQGSGDQNFKFLVNGTMHNHHPISHGMFEKHDIYLPDKGVEGTTGSVCQSQKQAHW